MLCESLGVPVVEAWGVFVTKAWERDWKIRQIESDVKDERVVYVKKEQKREKLIWKIKKKNY